MIAGVSLDGTQFFYENPLESAGDHHRRGWFECACCPPNVARLLASLERHVYGTDGEAVWVNQYIGSTLETTLSGTDVTVEQTAGFPWDAEATLTVDAAAPVEGTVHVRVPEWSDDATISVDGEAVDVDAETATEGGYVAIERTWEDDRIEVQFERGIERLAAHPEVESDAGKVALVREPLVYCLEGVDNDRPLHQYTLGSDAEFDTEREPDLLNGVVTISGGATVPETDGWEGKLYRPAAETSRTESEFTAIPYYGWDNRDDGPMRVWISSDEV